MCGHMALTEQFNFSFGWFPGEGPTQNVMATLEMISLESLKQSHQ